MLTKSSYSCIITMASGGLGNKFIIITISFHRSVRSSSLDPSGSIYAGFYFTAFVWIFFCRKASGSELNEFKSDIKQEEGGDPARFSDPI